MTRKEAWTAGYKAQTKGAKVFDNPETGANRVQWFNGYAASERETFVAVGSKQAGPVDWWQPS